MEYALPTVPGEDTVATHPHTSLEEQIAAPTLQTVVLRLKLVMSLMVGLSWSMECALPTALRQDNAGPVPNTACGAQTAAQAFPSHFPGRVLVLAPVHDQGPCGSCWAVGSTSVFEASIGLRYKTNLSASLSFEQVKNCGKLNDPTGCGGGTLRQAFTLAGTGVSRASEYAPYTPEDKNCTNPLPSSFLQYKFRAYIYGQVKPP